MNVLFSGQLFDPAVRDQAEKPQGFGFGGDPVIELGARQASAKVEAAKALRSFQAHGNAKPRKKSMRCGVFDEILGCVGQVGVFRQEFVARKADGVASTAMRQKRIVLRLQRCVDVGPVGQRERRTEVAVHRQVNDMINPAFGESFKRQCPKCLNVFGLVDGRYFTLHLPLHPPNSGGRVMRRFH